MTEQQKIELFLRQKHLLNTFLSTGAISKTQYDKSLGDLITKMKITDEMLRNSHNLVF